GERAVPAWGLAAGFASWGEAETSPAREQLVDLGDVGLRVGDEDDVALAELVGAEEAREEAPLDDGVAGLEGGGDRGGCGPLGAPGRERLGAAGEEAGHGLGRGEFRERAQDLT